MKSKNKYYVYCLPSGKSGVVDNWPACEKFVSGIRAARYRGFGMKVEAEAWLAAGAAYEPKARSAMRREPGIYFDAGTGRGKGVEVSVTDEHGKNLLHKTLAARHINRFGKHRLGDDFTNNYGELLAMKYALLIVRKEHVKKIFGDSKLVIDYWSQWRVKRKNLPEETVELADEVAELREKFEAGGGKIIRIGGGENPADLGFHRQ